MRQATAIRTKERGFTIVELIVVIVIIGILIAMGYIGLNGWRDHVAETEVKNDLQGVATAMGSARNWDSGYPVFTAETLFDGNVTTRSIFTQSAQVTLRYARGTSQSFCIDASSLARPGIAAYLDTAGGNTEPRTGMCPP